MYLDIRHSAEPPVGHVIYCQIYMEDCTPNKLPLEEVWLTRKKLLELAIVNLSVNLSVFQKTDIEIYNNPEWWDYPYNNMGDCEDFVLEKRKRLMAKGWPRSALLITYVVALNGKLGENDHAVLTVSTEYGDIILDNLNDDIRPWQLSPYQFVSRQSPFDPAIWQSIIDDRRPFMHKELRIAGN